MAGYPESVNWPKAPVCAQSCKVRRSGESSGVASMAGATEATGWRWCHTFPPAFLPHLIRPRAIDPPNEALVPPFRSAPSGQALYPTFPYPVPTDANKCTDGKGNYKVQCG